MLDNHAVSQLVQQEIKKLVSEKVSEATAQEQWILDLEKQIVDFVQARIVAKFSNIQTVPDLITTVEQSVERLFEQGFIPGIDKVVDNKLLEQAIDQAVEQLVSNTIDNLTVSKKWQDKIQNIVNQKMVEKIASKLREVDIHQQIEHAVGEHKDSIVNTIRDELHSEGITDKASQVQLSVMDGFVVVENELVSSYLTSTKDASIGGDLTVSGDLAIKGRINTDNPNWNELATSIGDKAYDRVVSELTDHLTTTITDDIKRGVNIQHVKVGNQALLADGKLADTVVASNLETVGTIKNLRTEGRLGINTQNPDSALTLWDDEVQISIGKQSKNSAFIGTNKKQKIAFGTNRENSIEINDNGEVWVKNIRVGRNSIAFTKDGVPGYEGTKGDVVFNINYTKDQPFAWMCLGAYRWAEIR